MTAQPTDPGAGPDTGRDEVHLGGQAAVVVPVTDFLRLRALEQGATPQELADAEDTAAVLEWKARDAAGETVFVPRGRSPPPPGHALLSLRASRPRARDLARGPASGRYSFRWMRGTASIMSTAAMTRPMRTRAAPSGDPEASWPPSAADLRSLPQPTSAI